MKSLRSTRRMGVSVLAGGLAFIGSADATELIMDGSFENTAASSAATVRTGGAANPGTNGGWSTFSTYLYSTQYTMPGPSGSGAAFLRPYPPGTLGVTQSSQVVTQLVSLTATTTLTPDKIDSGAGRYNMSAWFSSYLTQGDYSDLTLEFLDSANAVIGEPIAMGGSDFILNLLTDVNPKYNDAKVWGQDVRDGTIPNGARLALIRIASTGTGAPDGYVDLVSLDVADVAIGTPVVSSAVPPNNAVNAGPVVDLALVLQDRLTAVDPNSIQLYLDDTLVTPTLLEKVETNTTVRFSAGVLPALSEHTYRIVFTDTGTPATTQTNQFRFTVADYLTLPTTLRTGLGTEDTTKPGFNVNVYQIEPLFAPEEPATAVQLNIPGSISFSEAVLVGLVGPNVADLTSAVQTNRFEVPGVINWITSAGTTANFVNDQPFPGIPGTSAVETSFIDEIQTYVRFPTAGYYEMGINNEDQFRLSLATNGVQRLQITAPTNFFIPAVAIATNITQLQFGGALPATGITGQVVYGTPSGNPDDACTVGSNTNLSGKIVLLDRGATNCSTADKAEQAQIAGAIAVLFTTPGDVGFPFRVDDINTNVHIPVFVIAENYGASTLKSLITNGPAATAALRTDTNTTIAQWDGPKGFGAVDVTFGFAVTSPGIYPMRLLAGQEGGNANLEWFTIQPDGRRILLNDTSNPDALLAFRARTSQQEDAVLTATKTGDGIRISWTGSGTLQETTTLSTNWTAAATQTNPQTVPPSGTRKFYRIAQ
jgi:hypothetical protein